MKRLLFLILAMTTIGAPVFGGPYYNLTLHPSSATMRLGGVSYVSDPTSPYVPTISLNGTGGVVTATKYIGSGAELTGITGINGGNQNYYFDLVRNTGADLNTYYRTFAEFPFVSSSTLQTNLLSGDDVVDYWITPKYFPPVSHIPAGQWSVVVYARKSNGGTSNVRVYAKMYTDDLAGGVVLVGQTSYSGYLTSAMEKVEVGFSTGVVVLNGARVRVELRTDEDGVGTTPVAQFATGLDYASRMSIPITPTTFVPFANASADLNLGTYDLYADTIIVNGINAGVIGAEVITGNLYGDGTNITGIPTLAGDNTWTGAQNTFENTTIFNDTMYTGNIQIQSDTPTISGVVAATVMPKQVLFNTGIQVNDAFDYAYNWIKLSTSSINSKYYVASPEAGSWLNFDRYGLVISSGIRAGASRVDGTGGVNIINSDGKIPALTSDYFANLDGTALTGLSTNDTTKVLKAGDTMTGNLTLTNTGVSTGNIIMNGTFPQLIKMDNNSGASNQFLGEIEFLQNGTGKHRIMGFGDTSPVLSQGLWIGADTTGTGTNVKITGDENGNPDLFVSSWTSVGLNTANPNAAYVLDANGLINAAGVYVNGEALTGGGGDDLGSHIATMTVTANYGLTSSTAISASYYQINGSTVLSSMGIRNVFVGEGAGEFNVSGMDNVYVGWEAGRHSTGSSFNVAVGKTAGHSTTSGRLNSYIGTGAGYGNTTGVGNVVLGHTAGGASGSTYSSSTLVGVRAGIQLTSGMSNLFIGHDTGDTVDTGSDNILIGNDLDAPTDSSNDYLNIGGLIVGDMSTSSATVLGNLGVNNLIAKSSVTAYNVTVSSTVCFPDGTCMSTKASGTDGSSGSNVSYIAQNFYSSTNGSNVTFTLTNTPLPNSLMLTKNGVAQAVTTDYTLSGVTITMNSAPASSTTLVASYAIADSSFNILGTTNTWTATQTISSASITSAVIHTITGLTSFSVGIGVGLVTVSSTTVPAMNPTATCPAGFRTIGCGGYCNTATSAPLYYYFSGETACITKCPSTTNNEAQARCARIQ